MPTETKPRIDRAAILSDHDGQVHTTPRPGRHHTIIGELAGRGYPTPITGAQGFVTDAGDFVDRKTAARIAVKAGQITRPQWGSRLYSEDLW